MAESSIRFDLIVTIVDKGYASDVIDASKEAGAEGGTIISGRGSGIHETTKIFGIPIEPEKDIVLTLIRREQTDQVLKAISDRVNIHRPGKGIAFVLAVEKTAGLPHLDNQ